MAYGSSELNVAAATVDEWLNEGSNGIDLLSSHNVMLAVLMDNSEQPGGGYQFRQSDVAEGNQWKWTVYGSRNASWAGVTRANQVNATTPTVPGAGGASSVATNAIWVWSFYTGFVFDNYQDRVKNSGGAKMVDLAQMYLDQLVATAFEDLGTDLLDNATGAEDKCQSFNAALLNTGVVGGIDQTDVTNNAWWRAQQETTAEVVNTQVIDYASALATHDTGKQTGIRRFRPDVVLTRVDAWAKLLADIKRSQKQEVQEMARGGAAFIEWSGMRIFATDRIVSDTVVGLNSSCWAFRYKTKMPEAQTDSFVPSSNRSAMWERGFNWAVSLGGSSMKHQFLLQNKRAS